ncbi:hypothetical protein ACT3CD_03545 [Geofilum sp. OHC36d9]
MNHRLPAGTFGGESGELAGGLQSRQPSTQLGFRYCLALSGLICNSVLIC